MTPSFLLDIRAAQTAATRECFSRSRPWDRASNGNVAEFQWFVEDATKAVSAAYWEIDGFAQSIARPHGADGILNRQTVAEINQTAAAVKATADAALSYASSVLTSDGPAGDLRALEYWSSKCREAYQGAFEHWQ